MSFVLEPRMLFDASVVAASAQPKANEAADSSAKSAGDQAQSASASSHDVPANDATVKPAESAAVKDPQQAAQKNDAKTPAANDKSTEADRAVQTSGAPVDSVLFIDPRVSGWRELADSVGANTKVVVIDPTLDGITQVTKALDGLHGLKQVDFLTYGQAGQIELGASTVNDAVLHTRAQDIAGWRDSLADNAQIQFWGCDVGAGTAGAAFVNDLHALTGVGVAASTDATGLATLGGDWALERTAGTVDPRSPFGDAAMAAYDTVLDAPTAVVTLSGPTEVLLGKDFTQTLTFDNTAANGTGYGPFVELFVPTAVDTAAIADYRAVLNSAKFLGADVSVQAITLTTTDPNHLGVLGAYNPLRLDASGKPTFVTAPPGFQAGDTMYVLTLPFGSFTSTQPKAEVTLNFSLDSRSELTSTQGLKMVARGGYQYGADALNNPGSDPVVMGADVQSGLNVKLLDVKTAINTQPGEGETATGSSHPAHYVVTLEPAPATSGRPINNLTFNLKLPDDVQWTGGAIAVSGGGVATYDAPTRTVTVTYASISAQQTIDIPVFVPQTAVGGSQVIDPVTGDHVQVNLSPTYTYSASNWTPAAGSFDSGAKPVSGSGNGTEPSFVAKPFAVQVGSSIDTNTGPAGFSPGDIVKYTINFQVSDYFDLSNFKLEDILGDGMTLLPGMTPVLSVTRNGASAVSYNFGAIADPMTTDNGQTVATSGGIANSWNYEARDANGQTKIVFDVGALLAAQAGGNSTLVGGSNGTSGSVTFYAKVLDHYTDSNGGASLRESDVATNTVKGTGDVTSHIPGSVPTTEIDNSAVTNQVASGNLTMEITKVGNTTVNPGDTVNVQAGQLVTYTVTYDLTQGDYGNLDLNAFLPLPVYNLSTMTAGNGTDVNTFKVLSDSDRPGGPSTPTVTVDTVGNSLSFNFGTYDSTANPAGQKVTVQFTLRASDQPFADGLALTAQAQASYTNAAGTNISDAAIRQQTMNEPSLKTKTGVVSLVENNGTAASGATYTGDTGTPNANPTGIFQPSGNGNVFTGTIPDTIAGTNALNQNVSGADGLDAVRIVQTVENVGHGVAYDVIVRGQLPSGYSAGDVTNLKVTRGDGTVLAFTGTAADFFTSGIQVHGGDGTQNSVVLEKTGDATNRDILYVTYDVKLTGTQAVGTALAFAGSIVNWSGANNGPGFVTSGVPVGGTAANLTDNATVTTTNASFTKTITSTDNPNTAGTDVVVGETITYTFTITLPEGEMGSVVFSDVMPTYLSNVVVTGVTAAAGVTADSLAVTYDAGTRTLSANFGTVKNANADTLSTITFTVTAKVADDGSVGNNSSIANTGKLTWDTGAINSTATATERDPSVTESITVNDPDGKVHSGQVLTYTFTVTNAGSPAAPAEDFFDTIVLPSGLTWVPGSLTMTTSTGATNVAFNDGARTVAIERLAAGGSATFTFQATVNNDLTANTSLQVKTSNAPGTYTSMPGTVTGERSYTVTASNTVSTGVFAPVLVLVDQSNGTDTTSPPTQGAPQATADVVVGELVRMKVYVEIPTGLNNNVNFTVNLPTGLEYVGNATIALASANGSMSSSVVDAAGNNAAIQVNSSGGFNVQTYNPTAALTAAAVSGGAGSGGDVTFSLGTVQNNANSGVKNYAIVEFNAVVRNEAGNQSGTNLQSFASVGSTNSANTTLTVKEPGVTITKQVKSIDQATGQVTWEVKLANNGNAIAYNVNLNDTLAGNQSAISGLTQTGGASDLLVSSGNGANALLASMTLGIGGSETFTYTTTVIDRTQSVANATAAVTYASLDDTNSFISAGNFYGNNYTGDGIAGAGTAQGERNGAGGLNDYSASTSIGLGLVQGNVWNDLGSALNTQDLGWNSAADTRLQGVALTGTWAGASSASTVLTDSNGFYSFLLPTNVATDVSAPLSTTSSSTGGATETLIYSTDGTAGTLVRHNESGLDAANAKFTVTANGVTAISGVNFGYRLANTAPIISTWGDNTAAGAKQYTIGGSAIVLSTGSTGVADTQLDSLVANSAGDYGSTLLTLVRNGGANSGDVFGGAGNATTGLFFNGSNVLFNGVQVGTFTMTGGTLSVTFVSGTNAATVQSVLNNVTYSFTGDTHTLDGGIVIDATLRDNNTQAGTTDGNHFQGTGGQLTSAAAQVRIEIAPASVADAFQEPNNTPASGNAIALVPSLVLVNDQFTQVVLTISSGYLNGEDVLSYVRVPATMGNINGVWDPATGTMTLTSVGGTATTAQWQTALRAVTYHDASDTPNTGTRTVTFSATGTDTSVISGTLATVTVAPADDSPVLADVNLTIPYQTEDNLGAPSGTVGFLASTLVGNGTGPNNVSDTDGPTTGMVITQADTSQGNWWYSTDGGATWTEFASSSLTAVSNANALHLVADGNTRLYFQPKTADWNGTIPTALTIRAWDQFSPTTPIANGTLANIGSSGFGTGINTAASAYSAATDTVSLTVDPVNDAPVAGGTATFPAVNEDTTPAGQTVSSLFTPTFNDTRDTVAGGSSANSLAGIAITANAATAAQGNWQYTLDGTTWVDVPRTGLGDATALILPSTASLRFVPEPNWNGTPGGLTVRLIDGSNTSNTPVAFSASSDVSTNGGTTAISAATVPLTTTVTAVNDAPVVSGTATIPSTEDASTGATVANVLTQISYTDGTDTVSGGSTGTAAAGLAITGNASTAAQGTWQYSTDGTTWVDIPRTGLSDTNAIVIPGTASLRFVPAADWNGTPGSLTARISDGAGGLPATGAQNLGTVGGTSQWSNDTITIGTVTDPVNDAPVASGTATFPPVNEDTTPAGQTVSSLFTPTFNDTRDTVAGGSSANSLAGIAITANAATAAQGNWQYTLDGTTWVDVPRTGLGDATALILPSTASLRFVPEPNWNGTPGGLTVRLIDGSNTSNTPVAFSASSDVSTNGGTTAISAATVPLTTTVTAVNDAPVVSGTATIPSTEDASTGATVANVLTQISYTDGTDTVSGGSTGTAAAGLAITGNASTAAQGTWQYSTDGTTWVDIPRTGLSDTNAIVIPGTASLRFVPAADWNGTPGSLTARISDGAGGLPATGAQNLGTVGGTSQWSNDTITIGTVTDPVNDAPVASGTATFPPVNEDTTPTGQTVSSLFTPTFNDTRDTVSGGSSANSLAGIAITANDATAAQGNWQYTLDGTTWVDVPRTGLGDATALILPSTASLRFVPEPNWNGTPGGLTVRLIDGSNTSNTPVAFSASSDVSTNGGTTAISAATVPLTTTVTAVNDAPVVSGTATVPPSNEDDPSATGTSVSTLLNQGTINYTDGTDTVPGGSTGTSRTGIAITGNASTAAQGTWQYSTDGGATWVNIPNTGLGDANAIVLPNTATLRFAPNGDWNGTPGSLTARVSDGDGGLPATGAQNLGTVGGTSQWSNDTITIGTTTPPVNDAPVASGTATLPAVPEDTTTATAPGRTVSELFTPTFNDSRDDVVDGSSANSLAGIAITANAATAAQGNWQYTLDGTTWVDVPRTGLGDATALILPSTASLRFVPEPNWNGTPGSLTVRLIDGSNTSNNPVDFSASSNVSVNGETTAISRNVVPLTTTVTAVNDAPVVSGTATIPSTEDASTGTTVANVLTQVSYTDGTDTISGGSTGTPAAGLAITGNTSTAAQGTWQYSTDGTTWIDIPRMGLSDTNAIVIPSTASLRFVPAADWNGTPGGLTARISDGAGGLPATGTQNLGTVGGTSQWSNDTIAIGTVTTPVNDAPVVGGTATIPSTEDASTGTTVGNVLAQVNYTDGIDTITDGSTGTPAAGLAITNNASTPAQGTWQYTTDGTTWVDIPHTGLSDTNAIVIPATASLRFVPQPDWNGTPGSLTARISDGTGGLPATGEQNLGTVGGTSQWSNDTITIGTVTVPVNDAPVATGTSTLPSVPEDAANPPGRTVTDLFLPRFNDSRDQVTDGSSANSLAGIAITKNDSTPAQGTWQYTLDGTTWVDVPRTGLGDTTALILPSTASLRFVPEPQWNGTPGGLTVRLIDGSNTSNNPVPFSLSSDVSVNGETTAISRNEVPLTTTVTAVNDAPVVSGTATVPPSREDNPSPTGTSVSELLGQGTVNYTDGTDTVPSGSTGTPSTGIAIVGNTATPDQGTWQYSTDGGTTWVNIPNTGLGNDNAIVLPNNATLRFEPTPNWNGTPGTLTARVSDGTGGLPPTGEQNIGTPGGTSQWSDGTITIGTTTPPVNDAPIVSGTATVPPGNEDTPSPTGTPVIDLLGQGTVKYDDGIDTVPGGSTGTPAAGIAIVGNTSTPDQGTWQYTTDGGTTWVDIPRTGLGDTNAIVIPATAAVRFVPQPDWNGTPGSLTARISDGTGGLPPTGPGDIATGIGGTGQWSTGTITIGTTTPPVNDAPVATGETSLPPVKQGSNNPPGTSVKDLFKPNFDDSRDTVPGGSTAHELAGIAIVGNQANPTQGEWRYSLDGGSTWTSIPSGLGDKTAIVLPATAQLVFVPNSNFSGTPGALTVRLIDSSAGPVTATAGVDVSTNGGTTPFSAAVVPLNTSITPVPPVITGVTPNVLLPADYLSDQYGDVGFYRRDLGGMPSDWLVGSNVYRTMLANQPGTAAVSTDVFYGTAPRQNLRYEAASISGGPIPAWLFFDPTLLTFTGTPPEGSEGSYDLRVVATDRHGRQATADVHIVVLREPRDILGLLRPAVVVEDVMQAPAALPPPPAPPEVAPPGTPPTGDPEKQPSGSPNSEAPPSTPPAPTGDGAELQPVPGADPATGQTIQGFGLSPQLREQTQAGRLAKARALLDALAA